MRFFVLRFLIKFSCGVPEVADKCPIIIEQRRPSACSNYPYEIIAFKIDCVRVLVFCCLF